MDDPPRRAEGIAVADVLGIDEAGRGPVIGPLVLCGVWLDGDAGETLLELGVRDSKTFGAGEQAQERRAELATHVRTHARAVIVEVVAPDEIDRWVASNGLNKLERAVARQIIEAGPRVLRIVADGARLFGPLARSFARLEALDRADAQEIAVAAASVVAKVERDAQVAAIYARYAEEWGPIAGGGYPNAATERFLRGYVERHGRLPDGVRRSWGWRVLAELDPRGRDAPCDATLPLER